MAINDTVQSVSNLPHFTTVRLGIQVARNLIFNAVNKLEYQGKFLTYGTENPQAVTDCPFTHLIICLFLFLFQREPDQICDNFNERTTHFRVLEYP